jgi:hypothetical protein
MRLNVRLFTPVLRVFDAARSRVVGELTNMFELLTIKVVRSEKINQQRLFTFDNSDPIERFRSEQQAI